MRKSSALWARFLVLLMVMAASLTQPGRSAAQGRAADPKVSYFRTVGDHFQVPYGEVAILGEWGLEAHEVPVVLFIAGQSGVAPDVVVGMRRGGTRWMDVARRFGLGARAFHMFLPDSAPLGELTGIYEEFRDTPPNQWESIDLRDADIVALVNLRVLADQLEVNPTRVLRAWNETNDFLACHHRILGMRAVQRPPYLSPS